MAQQIPVTIDHKLRVSISDLPDGAMPMLTDALSIPNLEKLKAQKFDEFGWQRLPDFIPMYELDPLSGVLRMPRGFLADFATGMMALGAEVKLIEGRCWQPLLKIGTKVKPRPWQGPQIEAILANEQGILQSPAGSGKTVSILAAIQRLGCKSLVIVNTKDILWQWQERVVDFLGPGYPFGQIGDGKFDVSPYITIATAQTIHSRYEQLEADGFFDEFSFVCLDECHHATAETYNKILNRFSARFRIGVSATPEKTGDFLLAQLVLGNIIHRTKPDEVTSLMKPTVIRVPTDFSFAFRGHRNRYQRSNYPQMIDALIRDPDRNMLITEMVMAEAGHHQLLVSKRLEHLAILRDLLEDEGFPDPIVTIVGQDDNEHRIEAKKLIEVRPGLVLSTLADEAMDIPRLDRLHLPFPQRNTGLVTQQVGRVEREHPDKLDAKIFDYTDGKIGVYDKQWKGRRFEVYEPRGYKIVVYRKQVS